MIIEEDIGAENTSQGINTKRSKNSKISNLGIMDKSYTSNNNLNLLTEDLKSPAKMKSETPESFNSHVKTFVRSNSRKKSLKTVTTYYDDQNYENLDLHYDKEVYENYINVLYTNLFEWLLNKKESNNADENFIDFRDIIVNEYIIEIFIKFCNLRNITIIQRFLQEIHLLLANNRENSLILFKNKNFYYWLVETSFKFYQKSQLELENVNALAIYDFGKKIHTELIINTIMKEEKLKSESMTKISNLLSWGIYYKNMYCNQRSNFEVNDFIKILFEDLLSAFKDKTKVMSPNLNFSIWENLVVFSIFCYEYMTFYNLEKMLKLDASTLTDWNFENIIVPRGIISGLNLEHLSRESLNEGTLNTTTNTSVSWVKKNLATELWSDYKLYESFYVVFSKFWDKSIFDNNEKTIVTKYDKLAKELVLNKKQKDHFIEQIKLLNFTFKQENFSYNINLVKVLSNMLSITISLMQEEVEIKYWLGEYENFLKFLILASSNMLNKGDLYPQFQETTIDIVCFGLCFLIDEHLNTKRNSTYIKLYSESIRNIFILLCMIYKNVSDEIVKKKKKISMNILGVLGKKSKNTLYKLGVYRIFSEIIVDKNKNPILTKKLLDELLQTNFNDVPNIFKSDIWKLGLTENILLKQRCKFLFDFNTYENIIKMRYDMMSTYKPLYNIESSLNEKNYEIHIIEKGKFIKTIEKTIPIYEKCFKEYQNNQYNLMRDKRLLYKCLKKKLFQWRGFWSDRKLFYENYHKLKLKISNHYTSYLAKPILNNILDIDYYLPVFTKFDRSTLFLENDNNFNYRIVLNIDEVLGEEAEAIKFNKFALLNPPPKIDSKMSSNKSLPFEMMPNNRNFIFDIYKNANFSVWRELDKISNLIIKPQGKYEHFDLFSRSKLNSKNEKYENVFECCYVKLSHHIKGLFCLTKDGISFKPYFDQFSKRKKDEKGETLTENNVDDDYDIDRNTCYGSTLTFHHKDKDIALYYWPLSDIKFVIKKRYYYKKKAIEFFTYSNKSHFFTFKDQAQKDQVMKLFMTFIDNKREIKLDQKECKDNDDKYIGIENILNTKKIIKTETLSNKISEWANWKVSNFELIMFFNAISNRSFNDITQYPIFPWIVKNYKDSKVVSEADLRELNLPVGMIETDDERSKRRKKKFIDEFKESGFESGKNRHYGSHYSNPLYVSHYLTRLFPVVQIHIELQGDRFDDPNRLFFSMINSFLCATTQQGDVRELIPEFFYLPEMMLNVNNLNLGKRVDEDKNYLQVENVEVAKWSNDVFDFVAKMKETLENDDVSYRINDWIDLIFGFKQTGKEAEMCGNVFEFNTYEENINLENHEKANRSYFMRSAEFGLTPCQVLNRQMFPRYPKDGLKRGKQVTESKDLKAYGNPNSSKGGKNKEKPVMLRMKVLETDRVICVYNNNTYNLTRFTPSDFKYNITVESKPFVTNDQDIKIHSRIPHLFNDSNANNPMIIYSNGKIFAQGGYFDGRISVSYNEMNINKCHNYFVDSQNPILVLKIDKEEKYAFAGSKLGIVYIYKINEHIWTLHRTLPDHTDEITSIFVSNTLNVFATSSIDGYMNLYTFPNSKLFRSIKLANSIPIDEVFLSAYPLPCVVIYSRLSKYLVTYSINGTVLNTEEEDCKCLLSPVVFSDINFNDFLIYGTTTGDVKIRKFPSMNLIQKLTISDKTKNITENRPIKCIDVTEDKKFIYLWQYDDVDITLVKDPSITSESSSVNLINMGFGY